MIYSAKLNGETFFSTNNLSEKFMLTSAVVEKEAGVSGKFTFTVPPANKFYGYFHKLTDYVDVYRDGKIIFSGRVFSISEAFDTQIKIECESMLAVLNDSVLRPRKFEYTTAHDVFRAFISNHNDQVEEEKQLKIGRINVPEDACYRDYQKIETTLKRLNDLSESYGGRVEIRRELDGLYVDWLKSYDEGCDQLIDFGSNMLDLTKKEDAAAIVTVLIPTGAKSSDGKTELDIKSVNDGLDYVVADEQYIQKYGYIYGTKNWKDVTVPENLKRKAQEWVNSCCVPQVQIKVTAVDLANAGIAADNFDTGMLLKVRAVYHGLAGDDTCWFECKKIKINLLDPKDEKIELGTTAKGYIQAKRSAANEQEAEIEDIASRYVTKTSMEEAIESATALISGAEGGYIVIRDSNQDGQPDEILIMDTPDISTAVKVWRWNNNGLGFSSHGINGPYELAATIDGKINANFITTGFLDAAIIKAGILRAQQGDTYWNLTTGEFHFGADIDTDKSKNFSYIPTTPYFIGDLYVTGRVTHTARVGYAITGQAVVAVDGTWGQGGDILMCTNSRSDGGYHAEDWILVTSWIDDAEVESLKGRISRAEINISTTAEGLQSKVSITDFNGQTIASKINQSASTVTIDAKHISLNGAVNLNDVIKFDDEGAYTDDLKIKAANRSAYVYSQNDVDRIRDIIMGTVYPTKSDYEKYSLTQSGKITSLDYQKVRNCVNDYGGVYETSIEVKPNAIKDVFTVEDNTGNKTEVSAGSVATKNINILGSIYKNGAELGYIKESGKVRKGSVEWSYRKWTDGYYECWTSWERDNFRIDDEWGYLFEGEIGHFEYPVIFTETPNLQTAINVGDWGWMLEARNNTYTRQTTPTYYAVSAVQRTMKLGISILASGYISMTPDI